MIDDDPNLTTAKWVTQGLTRAFGVCIALRDESFDLTEEQVLSRIKEDNEHSISYQEKGLKEAQETQALHKKMSDADWKEEWEVAARRILESNKRSMEEAARLRERHDAARRDLIKLKSNTSDVSTIRIAEFGLEQLKLVESETKPYTLEIPTLIEFIDSEKESVKRDLLYHGEELDRVKKRAAEAVDVYTAIQNEVKRILG